MYNIFSYIL